MQIKTGSRSVLELLFKKRYLKAHIKRALLKIDYILKLSFYYPYISAF